MAQDSEQVAPEAVGRRAHPLTPLLQGAIAALALSVAGVGSVLSDSDFTDPVTYAARGVRDLRVPVVALHVLHD
jgi:hypothetical protein